MTTDSDIPGDDKNGDDATAGPDVSPSHHDAVPSVPAPANPAAGSDGAMADAAPPPRTKGGRLLASLALLVALAAIGGAGYLYYALIATADLRSAPKEIESLETRVAGIDQHVDQRLDQLARQQQTALDQLREQEAAARAASEKSLRQSLAAVARQAPPSTGEWQRAEAQYLLRIANHRLLLEHDVAGALQLLKAADAVLADLDDFALHEVRARIADEIASLEAVKGTDIQGLFLRLEAVKRHLNELPIKVPEYVKRQAEPAPPARGWWAALQRQLSQMVRVRHFDGAVKPLLGPDEAVYLELNLRLMLERAQLAAVRGQQMIYEQSLDTALDWIHQYLDTGKPAVKRMVDEITSLEQVELSQPLPDISGSLNALKEVLRHPE